MKRIIYDVWKWNLCLHRWARSLPSVEDGKPKSETSTIKTLTDTTLVTVEKVQGMTDVELEFKKK